MDSKKLFTTKMFLLLLIPFAFVVVCLALFILLQDKAVESYGINKTVGWAWDITNLYFVAFPLYIIYLLGYAMLFVFKIKTNYLISVAHFLALFIGFVYFDNPIFQFISALATFMALILFILNIIFSVVNQVKLNRSRI